MIYINKNDIIRKLYLFTIIAFLFGLVFSKFFLSLSQFGFLFFYLIDLRFKENFNRLKQNKSALIFISIYLIYILGLAWTQDFDYAIKDLRIKLPILIVTFVFASFEQISYKELIFILTSFVIIVFAKTLQSLYISIIVNNAFEPRFLSYKISHIRFSLIINLAFFAIFYIFRERFFQNKFVKFVLILLSIWFLLFLFAVQSLTGITVFFIVLLILAIVFSYKNSNKTVRVILTVSIFLVVFISVFYVLNQIKKFYTSKDVEFNKLETQTLNGNKYIHDSSDIYIENGYKVGYYLCEVELKKEWNKRSNIQYDSLNIYGYYTKYAVIRYLTSLGLPKDSLGLSKLTDNDINNINNGIANFKFQNKFSISSRIYKIIWQFHVYKNTGNSNDQSVTQRIEFLKTALGIIENNWLIGVGTGDVDAFFKEQYIKNNSKLEQKNRLHTHNQLISFFVALGFIGGFWCIFALFFPFFRNKKYKELLPSVFLIIIFFSMLDEDILETAVGVGFFVMFYNLLILQKIQTNKNISNDSKSIT